jgi:hypothetical protein
MLSLSEMQKLDELNARNGYGFSKTSLSLLIRMHERARIRNDHNTMEAVEYRLTGCNCHIGCKALGTGDYSKAWDLAVQMQ